MDDKRLDQLKQQIEGGEYLTAKGTEIVAKYADPEENLLLRERLLDEQCRQIALRTLKAHLSLGEYMEEKEYEQHTELGIYDPGVPLYPVGDSGNVSRGVVEHYVVDYPAPARRSWWRDGLMFALGFALAWWLLK